MPREQSHYADHLDRRIDATSNQSTVTEPCSGQSVARAMTFQVVSWSHQCNVDHRRFWFSIQQQ
jgi:hypothetical protein